jgi:hypothetical protein
MTKNSIIVLVLAVATTIALFYSFRLMDEPEKKPNPITIRDTEKLIPVSFRAEYEGEKITATTTLEQIIKASKHSSEIKIMYASRYENLVYASVGSGEGGGWYEIYYVHNDKYTQLASGQDHPMCSSFQGYDVPKGLWCRLGGCFEDNVTLMHNYPDCFNYAKASELKN